MNPQVRRIFGLDVLRAGAILLVLLSHGRHLLPPQAAATIENCWPGFYGVELFFALSGFLIGSILISLGSEFGDRRTLQRFWVRRWMRTLPNYVLFLLLNVVVFRAIGNSVPPLAGHLTFSQNLYRQPPPFFQEAWSLSVEEWFYLTFPLSLHFGTLLSKKFDRALLVAASLYLVIPASLRVMAVASADPTFTPGIRMVVLLRLDAVMFGVLAAWTRARHPGTWRKARRIIPLLGLLVLVALRMFTLSVEPDASVFARTALFSLSALACAMLLPFFEQWTVQRESAWTRTVRTIALWSYSLYLCHHGLLTLALTCVPRAGGWASWAQWGGWLATSFLVAAVAYRYCEKPIMDLRETRARASQGAPVAR